MTRSRLHCIIKETRGWRHTTAGMKDSQKYAFVPEMRNHFMLQRSNLLKKQFSIRKKCFFWWEFTVLIFSLWCPYTEHTGCIIQDCRLSIWYALTMEDVQTTSLIGRTQHTTLEIPFFITICRFYPRLTINRPLIETLGA